MGWVYIIIRTFPFWAIPTAFTILVGYFNARRRNKRLPFYWVLVAVLLIGASIFFLIKQGHLTAVPAAHSIFTGEDPNPR